MRCCPDAQGRSTKPHDVNLRLHGKQGAHRFLDLLVRYELYDTLFIAAVVLPLSAMLVARREAPDAEAADRLVATESRRCAVRARRAF